MNYYHKDGRDRTLYHELSGLGGATFIGKRWQCLPWLAKGKLRQCSWSMCRHCQGIDVFGWADHNAVWRLDDGRLALLGQPYAWHLRIIEGYVNELEYLAEKFGLNVFQGPQGMAPWSPRTTTVLGLKERRL